MSSCHETELAEPEVLPSHFYISGRAASKNVLGRQLARNFASTRSIPLRDGWDDWQGNLGCQNEIGSVQTIYRQGQAGLLGIDFQAPEPVLI